MAKAMATLKTKVLATISCLWIAGAALLVLIAYSQISGALNSEIRTRLRGCAALGALSVPADEHARLRVRADEGTKEYADVIAALGRIQAGSADVKFVYTVRRAADGKVVFIGDATEDEKDRSHLGDVYEDASELLKGSIGGIDGVVLEKNFYTDQWGTFLSAYAPIRAPDGKMDGLLCMDISFESVRRILRRNFLQLLLLAALCLLLIIPVGIYLTRDIVSPIKSCLGFTELLAQNDYSREPSSFIRERRDEIGDLLKAYGRMVANTRALILSIKGQAGALKGIGLELASNMNETAASINEINAGIQSVKREAINQAASVTETISTMEQITQNIQKLNGHIDQQAASVVQSSSAVEEMLSNISSVTATLERNAESAGELALASERGRSDLGAVSLQVREVARESEGLMEISKVIQTVASQTNLLAMNAAIEAAHAGDSGRGFSVVADEIRKLAESSGLQSKTISSSLRKMKEEMERITKSTDSVLRQFEAIDGKIKAVLEREQGIRDAMREQDTGSKEILEAVGQLNDITSRIKDGFGEMLSGSQEVIQESRNLSGITEEVSGSVDEMASGIAQISSAANNVNEISRSNRDCAEALESELGKFKV